MDRCFFGLLVGMIVFGYVVVRWCEFLLGLAAVDLRYDCDWFCGVYWVSS